MYRGTFSRNVFIVVMALAGASLGPLAAQAQQKPSPAAVAAAREVIMARGVNGVVDPVVRGVIESVKNTFIPTNPNLTRELTDVAMMLHKELDAKSSNEVMDEIARSYAARFTEQELKDLVAFYKTPLGQKVVREEPLAIDEGLKSAERWAQAYSETVMARMRSEMQKKGHPL
jgi:uncharacterized protein